MFFSFTIRS